MLFHCKKINISYSIHFQSKEEQQTFGITTNFNNYNYKKKTQYLSNNVELLVDPRDEVAREGAVHLSGLSVQVGGVSSQDVHLVILGKTQDHRVTYRSKIIYGLDVIFCRNVICVRL